MFAPVSFAYLYDCIDDKRSEGTAPITLGLLSTISNVVSILIPLVVGIYWNQYFHMILTASIICLTLAIFVGIRILPTEAGEEEAVM